MTAADRREHIRTALNAKVQVTHPDHKPRVFATRDISDGGIFIVVEDEFASEIGDQVQVQVQGLPIPAPVLDMVVVRKTIDGYGLQFAETGTEEDEGD
ncbi:PilZ domain-containing protein [Marinobacter sp.]|uniref:PilZ domain-containing protein n=1 Tax=Marinobacter sp. TaxID=50741 RepID=UPI00384FBE94